MDVLNRLIRKCVSRPAGEDDPKKIAALHSAYHQREMRREANHGKSKKPRQNSATLSVYPFNLFSCSFDFL